MTKVFSNFGDLPLLDGEKNSGKVRAEQTYIRTDKQIQSYINAGIRLDFFRKNQYDYVLENPNQLITDFKIDPTRKKDFDLAEAKYILDQIYEKAQFNKPVDKPPVVEPPVVEPPVVEPPK